jgi:dGTP triphosphohydrolase
MMERVYGGPVVMRQNYRARHILRQLFGALMSDPTLLPIWSRQRIETGGLPPLEVAIFLAGLTDRGAADLYAELFEPTGRAMGHRIL